MYILLSNSNVHYDLFRSFRIANKNYQHVLNITFSDKSHTIFIELDNFFIIE